MGTLPFQASSLLKNRYSVLTGAAWFFAAYLCLVNLGYTGLWHDEASTAVVARNLLQQGDITGWDGRNLAGGGNAQTLNADLRDVLPPLMYLLTAAGFKLFGVDELGARIVHALLGVLSLGVFWLLLRQHLMKHPRLICFSFLFAAASPQLLLYFRSCRYFSLMSLGLITGFYLYERYWQTKNNAYLAACGLIALFLFFGHYIGGTAAVLSCAAYHLIMRARDTRARQWLVFIVCGSLVATICLAWTLFIGLLGGEQSGQEMFHSAMEATYAQPLHRLEDSQGGLIHFDGYVTQDTQPYRAAILLMLLRIWIYLRELFTTDWVSWPIACWFVGYLYITWRRSALPSGLQTHCSVHGTTESGKAGETFVPVTAIGRIVLMGALFTLFSAALSMQPVWVNPVADLRYYMAALPLLLVMKGLFIEWIWRTSRATAVATLILLLCTSVGAWPFNIALAYTGKPTLGPHLLQFVREIHQPRHDPIRTVADYLRNHAAQDDLVLVPDYADRETLGFYSGDHVLFCCMLSDDSPLLKKLNAPHLGANRPQWIIDFSWGQTRTKWGHYYEPVTKLTVYPYPTQRPEINFHTFRPLSAEDAGVIIWRRKPQNHFPPRILQPTP